MYRNLLIFSAALALQLLAMGGTLATCAVLTRHLSVAACADEARLAGLDPSYCAQRQLNPVTPTPNF